MMTLVACEDPGLVILPTHRVVKSLPAAAIASFAQRARELFDVEEIAHRDAFRARLDELGAGAIGVDVEGRFQLSDPAAARARARWRPRCPARRTRFAAWTCRFCTRWCSIEYSASSAEEIRKGGNIEYTIEIGGALAAVAQGHADGAFLMNPPSIQDVERVSDAGATMPEKSTYFHPKLLTGLVMNSLFGGE